MCGKAQESAADLPCGNCLFLEFRRFQPGSFFKQGAERAGALKADEKTGFRYSHAFLQAFFRFPDPDLRLVLFGRLPVIFFEKTQQMKF